MKMPSIVQACALIALSMIAFGGAQAACNAGAVSCMAGPGAGQKQCTRTVMCNAAATGGGYVSIGSSYGPVVCSGGAIFDGMTMFTDTLVATATASGISHSCSWGWTTFTMSGSMAGGFFTISNGDGLPVELMEFSIPE